MKVKKLKNDRNLGIAVLLEDFNAKFDLLAEQTSQIPQMGSQINDLTEDMRIVKTDLEFIKSALKRKVDVEEFAALERRVISLESQLR